MILLHGIEVKADIFPDKTSQVWHLSKELLYSDPNITWYFEHEGELIHLFQLRELFSNRRMRLHIPYLPYARQDKGVSNETTFSFKVFAKLINQLGCIEVSAIDVHNPYEASSKIANFRNIPVADIHRRIIIDVKPDFIVFPDHGAEARYSYLRHYKFITFEKQRAQATGEIMGIKPVDVPDELMKASGQRKFLVVDDICDGGATFIALAEQIRRVVPDRVRPVLTLFVTHGLFSKGGKPLWDAGYTVSATNSLPWENSIIRYAV